LPRISVFKRLAAEISMLENASEFCRLRQSAAPLEDRVKALPDYNDLAGEVSELTQRIGELIKEFAPLDIERRKGLPPHIIRKELYGLRGVMRDLQMGLENGEVNRQTVGLIQQHSQTVLDGFPCWAVTSLSVGSRLPLAPGIFDLAIIDEASQTDIPSAIPILFRAKRAGVVGDPFQLQHTSNLPPAKDKLLRHQNGLSRPADYRFSYSATSLYDLFSATDGVDPFFLGETYRSADDIAEYSNAVFYDGRLRVATDMNRLKSPPGMKPGIHWTQIESEVLSAGSGSCHCPEEVDEVARIVKNLLSDCDFKGTVGIVTPFRPQANRIQEALFDGTISGSILERSELHVDTAHGFQGDERDVMYFSLCAGPDMPVGSLGFLRKEAHLFNVAISRARAVVHVVGNRSWALKCGINHIELLARVPGRIKRKRPLTPWHPHESPWEEILYKGLRDVGLEPLPQHPVGSRRLDMALIKENGALKIDIEVDGDCHRNADGSRKEDDIWRDIQLQSLGWKVMRFWTYQLRENRTECIDRILDVWRSA
jgi:very-short-patch-repair endonuclease